MSSLKAHSTLPNARQHLFANSCSVSQAVKCFVKTQAVVFGLQLGAWQWFFPDEVRREAEDTAALQLETSFHGYLARL